jgi:RNA recognition motif-containing protein
LWPIFQELEQKGLLEGVVCTQDQETEVIKMLDSLVILLEGGNYEDIKNLDSEMNNNDSVKHKSSSLFVKNLHQSITQNDLEGLVSKFPGYQRLAVNSEADKQSQFARKAWISFKRNAKIREICYALNNSQINGQDLQAVVNKDLSRRTRICPEDALNHPEVITKDISIAVDLIKFKDAKTKVWEKVGEVTPKVVGDNDQEKENQGSDEVNKENTDDATNKNTDESEKSDELKDDSDAKPTATEAVPTPASNTPGPSGSNQLLVETAKLMADPDISLEDLKLTLDRLIIYLRMVHSIDFYGQKEYRGEDDMPNRCGFIHIRSDKQPDSESPAKFLNTREEKFKHLLQDKKQVGVFCLQVFIQLREKPL